MNLGTSLLLPVAGMSNRGPTQRTRRFLEAPPPLTHHTPSYLPVCLRVVHFSATVVLSCPWGRRIARQIKVQAKSKLLRAARLAVSCAGVEMGPLEESTGSSCGGYPSLHVSARAPKSGYIESAIRCMNLGHEGAPRPQQESQRRGWMRTVPPRCCAAPPSPSVSSVLMAERAGRGVQSQAKGYRDGRLCASCHSLPP
jgi:hypothetical protein